MPIKIEKDTKLILSVAILIISIGALRVYDHFADINLVTAALKIQSLPPSVKGLKCESGGLKETIDTCFFEISPNEFDLLNAGRNQKEAKIDHSSYTNWMTSFHVGPEFKATREYRTVTPPEFDHGGAITLVANDEKDKVVLHVWRR